VGAIGLGGLPMSVEGRPDQRQAEATIHAALDHGVTLIDTADCYGIGPAEVGHNERLIAAAVDSWGGDPGTVMIATKGGLYRTSDGAYHRNGHPDHLKRACVASLRALGRETIDLYQLHAVDPAVPYLDSVGALRDLQDKGMVRFIGLSNVTVAEIELARSVVPVVSVQNRLAPGVTDSRPELDHCTATGIAFLPWAPLGGLAAKGRVPLSYGTVGRIAAARGWSPQRVCLTWLLATSPMMIPIPGSSRRESVIDNVAAADAVLTSEELSMLASDGLR
jgi:aryl-alcohol dehydrogenase-like predicted oxidoreductase